MFTDVSTPAREPNARGEGDQLRRQLVRAAGELLLQPQPVALPSLRAVARACSVSPAAVYLHFASQAALIQAVLDEQLDALGRWMRDAVDPRSSAVERLQAFALAYVTWGLAHPGGYQLLFETADRLQPEAHGHERWDLIEETHRLVQEVTGSDEVAAEAVTFGLWAQLHGVVSLRVHKVDVSWPRTADADVRTLVDQVRPG